MRAVNGTLPAYYEQDLSDMSVGDGRIFTCPSVVLAANSFLSISLSPDYYDYSLCECARYAQLVKCWVESLRTTNSTQHPSPLPLY
jgi:hypothetical protein